MEFKRRSAEKKIFVGFLLSNLLIAAAVLLSLGIMAVYSIRRVRQDIYELQDNLLEEVRKEMDMELKSIEDISEMFSTESEIVRMGYFEDDNSENRIEYSKLKPFFQSSGQVFSGQGDVFIYYVKSSSVLTSSYRYSRENVGSFASYQMKFNGDQLYQFLNSETGYYILHPGTADSILLYMLPIVDRESAEYLGKVVVKVSLPEIVSRLSDHDWMKNSLFYITYSRGSLCVLMDDEGTYRFSNKGLETISDLPAGDAHIDGEQYHISEISSSHTDWNYRIAVPKEIFTSRTSVYQLGVIFSIFGSVLLSGIVAFVMARRYARPTGRLLQTMKIEPAGSYKEVLQSVEKSVLDYQNRLSSSEKKRELLLRRRKNDLVIALCHGNLSAEEADQSLKELQISREQMTWYRVVLLRLDHLDNSAFSTDGEVDYNLLRFVVQNVFGEILHENIGQETDDLIAFFDAQKCVSIIADMEFTVLRQKLVSMKNFLQDRMKVRCSFFVSDRGTALENIPEYYQQVTELQEYRLFWGSIPEDILFYSYYIRDFSAESDISERQKIFNMISVGQYGEARKSLEEYLDESFTKNIHSFEREKVKLYGLISDITDQIQLPEREAGEENEHVLYLLGDITKIQTFAELKNAALSLFDEVIRDQDAVSKEEIPYWISDAKQYIEEHYNEPDINVAYLAEQYELSPAHFSRMYKKYTNTGILDFINLIRVSHAKELLRNGVPVHETAVAVGYTETRALIRYFRRYEGITPGQFRENCLKK